MGNTNASHLHTKNKGMEKKVSFIDRTKSTLRQAVNLARRFTPSPAVLANDGKEEQQNKDTTQIAKNRFSANDNIEDPRHEIGMGAQLSHATSNNTKPDDCNSVYNLNTIEETSQSSIVDETEPVKHQFRDELTPGSKRSSNNIRRQSPVRNNEKFLYPTNIDTDKVSRIREKISDQRIEAKASIANQSTPKPDRRYGDPGCTVDSPQIQSLNKKALVSYEISTKSVKKKLESSKSENNGSMSSILCNKSNKQGLTESIKNVSELEKSVESSQFVNNINPDESNISRSKKLTCSKCGTDVANNPNFCGTCGTIPCKNALSYRTPSFVQRMNSFRESAKKQTPARANTEFLN